MHIVARGDVGVRGGIIHIGDEAIAADFTTTSSAEPVEALTDAQGFNELRHRLAEDGYTKHALIVIDVPNEFDNDSQ